MANVHDPNAGDVGSHRLTMTQQLTIDQVLARISQQLNLSGETEWELLEEIRNHLEDAVADAKAGGENEQVALLKAAEQFGLEEVATELQAVHAPWESTDAIVACMLPIFCTLILRWLAFSADGTAIGWQQLLSRPMFWVVATLTLVVPMAYFRRWHFALIGWGFFWAISVIFVVLPTFDQW